MSSIFSFHDFLNAKSELRSRIWAPPRHAFAFGKAWSNTIIDFPMKINDLCPLYVGDLLCLCMLSSLSRNLSCVKSLIHLISGLYRRMVTVLHVFFDIEFIAPVIV